MDREGGNKEKRRKCKEWEISSFSFHFLFIFSFSLHFLSQVANLCSPEGYEKCLSCMAQNCKKWHFFDILKSMRYLRYAICGFGGSGLVWNSLLSFCLFVSTILRVRLNPHQLSGFTGLTNAWVGILPLLNLHSIHGVTKLILWSNFIASCEASEDW